MPDEKPSVVIGMPEGYWNLVDEETTARLLDPHPNVAVETARDTEQFTEIASHVAAFTDGGGKEVGNFMIENIRRFAENEPLLGIVHRHEGY